MNRTICTEWLDQDFVYKGPDFACFALLAIWSRIHERTTSLRFLGMILRVLRLEDVFWRVSLPSHLRLFKIIFVQLFMSWFDYSLGGPLAQQRVHPGCHAEIRTWVTATATPQPHWATLHPIELCRTSLNYATLFRSRGRWISRDRLFKKVCLGNISVPAGQNHPRVDRQEDEKESEQVEAAREHCR
jgi:hypothetical protein